MVGFGFEVFLLSPLPPPRGGIATWTECVLREASSRGISIKLCDTAVRWRSVHQREASRRIIGGTLVLVNQLARVARLRTAKLPVVLHLCTSGHYAFFRDILLLRVAKARGIATVCHLHFGRIPELAARGNWEWKLAQAAIRIADCTVVLEESSRRELKRALPTANVLVLPNFLNARELVQSVTDDDPASNRDNRPRVIYIGWLVPAKGVLELVTAVRRASRQVSIVLELVGPGDPSYIAKVLDVGKPLGDRLIYRGELPRHETLKCLNRATVFALPSHSEGFPLSLLEAMALRKAIVATTVGAIPEMLGTADGPCGLLVAPEDIEAMQRSLERLVTDASLSHKLGRMCSEKMLRDYDGQVVIERLLGVWRACALHDLSIFQ